LQLIGVSVAFFLVDSLGRRPLLLWGSIGCTSALVVLMAADAAHSTWLLLLGMCSFVLSFSLSWAGVFWVLLSEVFSMTSKSPAAFAATATLFLTGAAADLLFLTIHKGLGAFSFLLYALIALAAAIYVAMVVPETKGRTLQEVQNILQSSRQGRHGVHEAASLSWDGEQLMPPGMQQRGSSEGAGVQLPEKGMGKDKHRFPLVDRWR
jgi:MFS family permease